MQPVYKSLEELPAMLTVSDVRFLFDIGRRQAYELVHSEGFPTITIGTTLKVPKHLLVKWIDASAAKGANNPC